MISYVSNGTYFGLVAGVGGPKTLHFGHRFDPICPEENWDEKLKQKAVRPTGFACDRCGAPVLISRLHHTQALQVFTGKARGRARIQDQRAMVRLAD